MKKVLFILTFCSAILAQAATVSVDATKEIATVNRANLMGINIAIYNPQHDLQAAFAGRLADQHPEIVEQMSRDIDIWFKQTGSPLPPKSF